MAFKVLVRADLRLHPTTPRPGDGPRACCLSVSGLRAVPRTCRNRHLLTARRLGQVGKARPLGSPRRARGSSLHGRRDIRPAQGESSAQVGWPMLILTPSSQAAPSRPSLTRGGPTPWPVLCSPVLLSNSTVFSRARNRTLQVNKTLFLRRMPRGAALLPSDRLIYFL